VLEAGHAPRTLHVGGRPVALAADARSVFVAGADGAVTRLDARRRRIAGSVRLGGTPIAVALAGDAAWVADAGRGTVRRIALGSSGSRGKAALVAGPPVAVGREPVALAAGGRDVYVVCRGDRTLVRVDARSGAVSARVRLEAEPAAVALDLEHVWIAAAGRSVVMRVDRRRLE
jgi:DNA-binding beta-propeller fold protein YncE